MECVCPAGAQKLPAGDLFHAAASGDPEWLCLTLRRVHSPSQQQNKQGLTVLHVAAQHGQLNCLKLLLNSCNMDVNASCPRGWRPLHMALSPESKPNSYCCLTYLLEYGAEPNVCTDEGLTPLHIAAAEGLKECVEALLGVGADTHACDRRGHTPLELACLWGHRLVARILKNAMWHRDKKRDMEKRQELQNLKQNMIRMHRKEEGMQKQAREAINKQKVSEWAVRKGIPCLRSPTTGVWKLSHHCCHSAKQVKKQDSTESREMWNISPNPSRPPPANISRSKTVRIGVHPEETADEPDLRQSVTLHCFGNGHVHYTASWADIPQPVPELPLDVIQKGLFPAKFPSRIPGPLQLQCSSWNLLDLAHRGGAKRTEDSSWTEVAMHLAEELQPGHY